jgi:hypothetical protein
MQDAAEQSIRLPSLRLFKYTIFMMNNVAWSHKGGLEITPQERGMLAQKRVTEKHQSRIRLQQLEIDRVNWIREAKDEMKKREQRQVTIHWLPHHARY